MKVIAGSAKGKKLDVPGNPATRPMLGMAKGALFNILGKKVKGARVLDLYAGSGALGIEALSRGAAEAFFVEMDSESVTIIERNLKNCRLDDRVTVLRTTCEAAFAQLNGRFNLVFADPPFADSAEWHKSPEAASFEKNTGALLAENGLLVFRLEKKYPFPDSWGGRGLIKDRAYGRSRVCVYG